MIIVTCCQINFFKLLHYTHFAVLNIILNSILIKSIINISQVIVCNKEQINVR